MSPALRYQEIIKRKKSIVYHGKTYRLPRYAHDAIFKLPDKGSAWPFSAFRQSFRRGKVKAVRFPSFCRLAYLYLNSQELRADSRYKGISRPLPLYRRALAYERSLHYERINRELREGLQKKRFSSPREAFDFISTSETVSAFEREAVRESRYIESLRLVKDGQ